MESDACAFVGATEHWVRPLTVEDEELWCGRVLNDLPVVLRFGLLVAAAKRDALERIPAERDERGGGVRAPWERRKEEQGRTDNTAERREVAADDVKTPPRAVG